MKSLQSLFLWIIYLFLSLNSPVLVRIGGFNPYFYGLSIYLTVQRIVANVENCFNPYFYGLSIYFYNIEFRQQEVERFNPYFYGLSIYLIYQRYLPKNKNLLQSLFLWIIYLFQHCRAYGFWRKQASILIFMDYLSI